MAHMRTVVATCLILLALPQLVLASKSHVVRKSESLLSVARKYHVSVDELKSVNNLTASHVSKGMRLIIPSHADSQQKKPTTSARLNTYKVSKGDSLPKIAKRTGVKMSDIRNLNGLKGNRIKPGQVLILVAAETTSRPASTNRLQLINKDLLNEQELTDTLAELTDLESDRPVDLAKTLEASHVSSLKKSAFSFLGARYRFGGSSRNALDCSSFTQQVFREQSVKLPRTAREQFSVGNEVMRGDLKKGDLVFFQTYASFPSHVGIYLGNRKMIHASSREHRVVISSMDTPYYLSRYLGARRMTSNTDSDAIDFNELLLGVEEENEHDILTNDTLGVSLNLAK
ncbi:MAG: NlpC/P60 family protein [Desulfuromonadaceae bacterium]